MARILQALEEFFVEDDWIFDHVESKDALRLPFRGSNGDWTCYAQAREKDQQFLFYSVCPLSAPPDARLSVAEFLTRANFGLLIGNFEMDWSDGEVRFKTGFDVENTALTSQLIRPAVYANVITLDKYLPGIGRVLYADVTAAQAIAEIESQPA